MADEVEKIDAESRAAVEKLRAWQHFVIGCLAVIGSIVLTGLQIMPVEVTSNVITTCVMVLVLRKSDK